MVTTAAVLWTIVLAAGVFWVYARVIEPRNLQVRYRQVPLVNLPPALVGLRIVHLSDFHCCGQEGSDKLARRAIAETLRQRPHLVVISGDLSNGSNTIDYTAEVLKDLSAPYGVYAVLGNHDWNCTLSSYLFGGPSASPTLACWRQALASTNIEIIENSNRQLTIEGHTVIIAGLGDTSCGRDNLQAALQNADPGDLKIVLTHSPDAIDLPGIEWADLLLAGHTHGGQCCLPGLGSIWAPIWRLRRRSAGLMHFGETVCHVSRGIGAGIDARFLCPPEIVVLTLVPGPVTNIPSARRRTAVRAQSPDTRDGVDSYDAVAEHLKKTGSEQA